MATSDISQQRLPRSTSRSPRCSGAWGPDEDIIARLVKKTLFVGVFAYLIGNWNSLARIVFESFAGLGLKASGASLSAADFLRPGKIAQVGLDAGRPILDSISSLMGYISFFENFVQIVVLLFAWVVVLLAFFILAIQLFVTLIEFKLTTLAGFVLIPFGLFGKTAFAAERVLATSYPPASRFWSWPSSSASARLCSLSSPQASAAHSRPSRDAMTLVLAALSLLGLGIFGPGIANGLVSGGPQLGAGAAIGTGLAAGGVLRQVPALPPVVLASPVARSQVPQGHDGDCGWSGECVSDRRFVWCRRGGRFRCDKSLATGRRASWRRQQRKR